MPRGQRAGVAATHKWAVAGVCGWLERGVRGSSLGTKGRCRQWAYGAKSGMRSDYAGAGEAATPRLDKGIRHCGRNAIALRPQAKFLGAETPFYIVEVAFYRRAQTHIAVLR